MLCVRECPVWCITLDSHTEPDPDVPPGARVRLVNVLDRFVIDWNVCMYCGICVEECPFDALEWDTGHPAAAPPPPTSATASPTWPDAGCPRTDRGRLLSRLHLVDPVRGLQVQVRRRSAQRA